MCAVKLDRAGKCSVCYGNTDTSSEIRSDVLAEFVTQHQKFTVGRRKREPLLVEIYHCSTGFAELSHHVIKCVDNPLRRRVGWIESLYPCSGQSKSSSPEAIAIEALGVISVSSSWGMCHCAASLALDLSLVRRLTTATRPSAVGFEGAKVCPLRQIRFTEDNRTTCAQIFSDGGVLDSRLANERKGSGACLHPIAGIDIVFEQHRDTMQRPEHSTVVAQPVCVLCHLKRVRVELDDGVDPFGTPV